MALHGEVLVNGGQVSRWWAQRDLKAKPSDGWITYSCGWVSGGLVQHFKVRHHYDDGAEMLASRVLAAIPYNAHKVKNWGSGATPDPHPLSGNGESDEP